MNLLMDGLPTTVDVLGEALPISYGFRTGIRLENMINDQRLSAADRLAQALDLYFPGRVFSSSAHDAAVDAIIRFYRCGRREEPPQYEDGKGGRRAFSYEHDAGYIYAAFKQAYGIDLARDNIHWWQFRALFESLPDDTMLVRVIGYRTAEVPDKASDETRQRIEHLRRVYALPLDEADQQRNTDLVNILMAGGDPSALLDGGQSWHLTEH